MARSRASRHPSRRASSSSSASPERRPRSALLIDWVESKSSAMSRPPALVILVAVSIESSMEREKRVSFQTMIPSDSPASTFSTRRPSLRSSVRRAPETSISSTVSPISIPFDFARRSIVSRCTWGLMKFSAAAFRAGDSDVCVEHRSSILRFTSDGKTIRGRETVRASQRQPSLGLRSPCSSVSAPRSSRRASPSRAAASERRWR